MQNEHQFQSRGHAKGEAPPEEDKWSEFDRDLETLGRQLSELRSHTAVLGDHLVASLEAQFQAVRGRAHALKQATERHIDEIRESAWRQVGEAHGPYSEMRARSKATALEMWERSEPLRQGARDVGEGLVRAWAELRASLGKAANRLSSSERDASERAADKRSDIS